MSEEQKKVSSDVSAGLEQTNEDLYLYRWNYEEQRAHDLKSQKKKSKTGAWVYALLVFSVFLICISLLIGLLVWYEITDSMPQTKEPDIESTTPMSTVEIAERYSPSVVLIYAGNSTTYSYGTGFFISEDGYIATNHHVIADATSISVKLYSGESFTGTVVGYSASDDLAVLKIKGKSYPAVRLGDSDKLKVGQTAIAIGHPSGTDAPWSTTQGIISALNREITVNGSGTIEELTMIQTDAPVNPGNSGGPLFNDSGEVIGILTRKLTGNEGIGFAIPMNGAKQILDQIIKTGSSDGVNSSVSKVRPTIGIQAATIHEGDEYTYMGVTYHADCDGVIVSSIVVGGSAEGILEVCDIITALDGKTVLTIDEMIEKLYTYEVGDTVRLTVNRHGVVKDVSVKLGKASS